MSTTLSKKSAADEIKNATALHEAGRLAEAETLCARILEADPKNTQALRLLSAVVHQSGDHQRALELADKAIKLNPRSAPLHAHRGEVLRALGKPEEAAASYRKAIELEPEDIDARLSLGRVLKEAGKLKDAINTLRKALAVDADSVDALRDLGNALEQDGRLEEAANALGKAISLDPGIPGLHARLGAVLMARNNLEEASASFRRAVEIDPGDAGSHARLGLLSLRQGRMDATMRHYDKALKLRRGAGAASPGEGESRRLTRAKLEHDLEQLRYLARLGHLDAEGEEAAGAYEAALEAAASSSGLESLDHLPGETGRRLGHHYNRLKHYVPAERLADPALNPQLDREAIETAFTHTTQGIAIVDDLLTPQALESLRRFCLESTIWFRCGGGHGEVEAGMEDGLLCPLLAQIAGELPERLPGILGDHRLAGAYAAKSGGDGGDGERLDADPAVVTVHLWLTPETPDRPEQPSGMTVWDKPAPAEWSLKRVLSEQTAVGEHLQKSGARSQSVPYRANRAVIVKSDLFHRTDPVPMAPGYENRRIDIVLLYGQRKRVSKSSR